MLTTLLRSRLLTLSLGGLVVALLLAAPAAALAAGEVYTGRVVAPGKGSLAGAIVVTNVGGSVAVREDGSFSIEVELQNDDTELRITALASTAAGTLTASKRVDRGARSNDVGQLLLASATSCDPEWLPTFGGFSGASGAVRALAVLDDGGGPILYAGGTFTEIGGVAANRVARYDGAHWSALGGGIGQGYVDVFCMYDDGAGPELYVGGNFSTAGGVTVKNIARWNGASWSDVGGGVSTTVNTPVAAMIVHDDGSGPALFVGGGFKHAGGLQVNNVARWRGGAWSSLGSGTNGSVNALAVFDDGGGPRLVAAGSIVGAGGFAGGPVSWDGASWSPVGSTLTGICETLAVGSTPAGSVLYAGGSFQLAGGAVPFTNVARWNGTSWSSLGDGPDGGVLTLAVLDDGSGGEVLYAGGSFSHADGAPASRVARWDGAAWWDVGGGVGTLGPEPMYVEALAAYDDGSGPVLFAGGSFGDAAGMEAHNVATWDGGQWDQIPGASLTSTGLNASVAAFAVFDDGGGPALHATGSFTTAGGTNLNGIGRWNGKAWSALGAGLAGAGATGRDLIVFDDGGGPDLYVGGTFSSAGGVPAVNVARWNGIAWSAVGAGLGQASDPVFAFGVYDDGSGEHLYAGGQFQQSGAAVLDGIGRWDGATWNPVGGGVSGGPVYALDVYDSGAGAELIAGGAFQSAGGLAVERIARWDGAAWKSLLATGWNDVRALAVFDDGQGPWLYVGGQGSGLSRWNGSTWSLVGSGTNNGVFALKVFDDGSGPVLYAGGSFTVPTPNLGRWDGTTWSAVGDWMTPFGTVEALGSAAVGSSTPFLFAGGAFTNSPAASAWIARYGCEPVPIQPGCTGNPATLSAPLATAALGKPFVLRVTGSQATWGLAQIFVGVDGTDPLGCGAVVPGIGELLLALSPSPTLVANGLLASGVKKFAIPVPATPTLAGATVALQGVAALPIELTNAIWIVLGP